MIYTYECPQCGSFELTQSIHDDPISSCPSCKNRIERIVTGGYASFVKGRTFGSRAELNTDKMGSYERDSKNKDILDKKAEAPFWRPNTLGPNKELMKKNPEQLDKYIRTGK